MMSFNNERDTYYFEYLPMDKKSHGIILKANKTWIGKSSFGSEVITDGYEDNDKLLIFEYYSAPQKWKPLWINIEQCEIIGDVPRGATIPHFVEVIGYTLADREANITLVYTEEKEKKLLSNNIEYTIIESCGMKVLKIDLTPQNEEIVRNL